MPTIKLLVEGGDMKPGPTIAQQLGPMGINMGKVISDINNATSEFKGMNVPVVLDVDSKSKDFSVKVLSPPTSELIKKELNLEKASGDRTKTIAGNIALERLIAVAKTKHPNMLAKEFSSALKAVIGTCMSLGIMIDNKSPEEILEDIKKGNYKPQIEEQRTEVSEAKKKNLEDFYNKLHQKQEAEQKAEEEEKAAEEENKETPEEKKEEEKK